MSRAVLDRFACRDELVTAIAHELDRAYDKHGEDPWGRHEFFAILKEEVDELWDAIKADRPDGEVLDELLQVAAMCFRYFETGDRYRGVSGRMQWILAQPAQRRARGG